MNKIIEINDLTVSYDNNDPVLENVNLTVYQNDFLGIIGPNGGGKTTLLKTILGLLKPSGGSVRFYRNGKNVKKLNIGYLPQMNQIDRKFPITVYEVILSGLSMKRNLLSHHSNEQREKVIQITEKMGLRPIIEYTIGDLSGGQLQRVLLARAIVDDPDILVLDEPSSYVDKRFESDFYDILVQLNKKTAIIMVSHDIGTVIPQVKNIACVNGGLHYHAGNNISTDWLGKHYGSCPIEIIAHGDFPHRILEKHDNCGCCNSESD